MTASANESQLELLSAIHAGPATGLAADAIASGDSAGARRKLTWAASFCLFFMFCEAFGGYCANSLAIMTDAAHLLADLAGFIISVFALWVSARPATEQLSFGWYRLEIIGALLSVILIWVVTIALFIEAIVRIQNPSPVDGKLMMILSTLGLCVNSVIALILHSSGHSHGHSHSGADHGHSHSGGDHSHSHSGGGHGHSHVSGKTHQNDHQESSLGQSRGTDNSDLETALLRSSEDGQQNINVRAAMIHAIGDMVQSIGVMIAAGLVWYNPSWAIIDPICTFGFGLIVLASTFGLLRECMHVLMEGAPSHINNSMVRQKLTSVDHVRSVHDLHIWSIKPGKTSLSVHLGVDSAGRHDEVLRSSQRILGEQFGITHSTIQIEAVGDACKSDCA